MLHDIRSKTANSEPRLFRKNTVLTRTRAVKAAKPHSSKQSGKMTLLITKSWQFQAYVPSALVFTIVISDPGEIPMAPTSSGSNGGGAASGDTSGDAFTPSSASSSQQPLSDAAKGKLQRQKAQSRKTFKFRKTRKDVKRLPVIDTQGSAPPSNSDYSSHPNPPPSAPPIVQIAPPTNPVPWQDQPKVAIHHTQSQPTSRKPSLAGMRSMIIVTSMFERNESQAFFTSVRLSPSLRWHSDPENFPLALQDLLCGSVLFQPRTRTLRGCCRTAVFFHLRIPWQGIGRQNQYFIHGDIKYHRLQVIKRIKIFPAIFFCQFRATRKVVSRNLGKRLFT